MKWTPTSGLLGAADFLGCSENRRRWGSLSRAAPPKAESAWATDKSRRWYERATRVVVLKVNNNKTKYKCFFSKNKAQRTKTTWGQNANAREFKKNGQSRKASDCNSESQQLLSNKNHWIKFLKSNFHFQFFFLSNIFPIPLCLSHFRWSDKKVSTNREKRWGEIDERAREGVVDDASVPTSRIEKIALKRHFSLDR